MFITNLKNIPLGINGVINLAPHEVNRFIDDKDKDLVARVVRLEAANLISVVRKPGLTKTGIPGKVVKTIGVDVKGLNKAPRTAGKVVTPAAPVVEAPVIPEAPKAEPVIETPVAEAPVVEAPVVEAPAEEAPAESTKEVKPAKASKTKPATRVLKAKLAAEAPEEAPKDEQ